jgi:RNA polymerase sigma-70 factor (ECF subfamily)
MANEQAEAVEKALRGLPADYQQVILLRYREELSFEEISRIMGRSANAVEKLWLRAIERLRQEMEQA